MRDVFNAPAILLIGNDPTEQHPLLAWQIRNNVRLHRAKLYVVNSQEIKLRRQAAGFLQIPAGAEGQFAAFLGGDDSAAEGLGPVAKRGRVARDHTASNRPHRLRFANSFVASRIWSSFSGRRFGVAMLHPW